MFIFLSKIIPPLVYPLGLGLLLILLAVILARRPRLQRLVLGLAFALLYLGGNEWIAQGLARSLEWRHLPPEELPAADAIVVLGGATLAQTPPRPIVELNEAGDRLVYAAWLYRQGHAPLVLLTGGGIEWFSAESSPADEMVFIMTLLGVPESALIIEPASRNTHENALFSRQLLEEHHVERILLVTSAMHMPRSLALFTSQGFEVIPAPADFYVTETTPASSPQVRLSRQLYKLLPSAENLVLTSRAIKEYLGLFVYRLRGWI